MESKAYGAIYDILARVARKTIDPIAAMDMWPKSLNGGDDIVNDAWYSLYYYAIDRKSTRLNSSH